MEEDKFTTSVVDREEALTMLFRDLGKIARREVPVGRVADFAKETLKAANFLIKPGIQ